MISFSRGAPFPRIFKNMAGIIRSPSFELSSKTDQKKFAKKIRKHGFFWQLTSGDEGRKRSIACTVIREPETLGATTPSKSPSVA